LRRATIFEKSRSRALTEFELADRALLPVEPVEPEEPIPATATVMVSVIARPNELFVQRPCGSRR
jgi:hypothetical protein